MKTFLTVVGVMAILMGFIWILQGINILGGSSMTGQTQWAVNGCISVIIGIGLLAFTYRQRIFKR
jgi:hypothetical protein